MVRQKQLHCACTLKVSLSTFLVHGPRTANSTNPRMFFLAIITPVVYCCLFLSADKVHCWNSNVFFIYILFILMGFFYLKCNFAPILNKTCLRLTFGPTVYLKTLFILQQSELCLLPAAPVKATSEDVYSSHLSVHTCVLDTDTKCTTSLFALRLRWVCWGSALQMAVTWGSCDSSDDSLTVNGVGIFP